MEASGFFRAGVGARSDIQDILDSVVVILLLEMSAAEFTDRHVGSNDEAAGSRRARCEGYSLWPLAWCPTGRSTCPRTH